MALKIYNTLTREKEPFVPLVGKRVNMYVCGPTVYDSPHIGHAKASVSPDIVVRYLRHQGYDVLYVQNITDVGHLTDEGDEGEDKILKRASERRVEPMQLVETYTREYFQAMDALNCLRPDISPRASGHIPEIIELIERLIAEGHAYESDGSVYFDVGSFPEYGKLSNRRLEEQEAGARVEIAAGKRDPADFALWKRAEPGHIMRWNSPWGAGFPGWHIECSAMSMKYLGETLDIHGAGVDNIFPHNEDEIAQSECATHRPFVRYWMHNGSLMINGVKMSKSLGNFLTVEDAIERFGAARLRYFLISSHYRSRQDFSPEAIEAAGRGLEGLQIAVQNAGRYLAMAGSTDDGDAPAAELVDQLAQHWQSFHAGMDDDFNCPAALGAMNQLSTDMNRVTDASRPVADAGTAGGIRAMREAMLEMGSILGLDLRPNAAADDAGVLPGLMELVLSLRGELRAKKEWALTDQIRDRLKELGVVVEDHKDGSSWRKVGP
jgi:cysteinyl-tRNA synthetase